MKSNDMKGYYFNFTRVIHNWCVMEIYFLKDVSALPTPRDAVHIRRIKIYYLLILVVTKRCLLQLLIVIIDVCLLLNNKDVFLISYLYQWWELHQYLRGESTNFQFANTEVYMNKIIVLQSTVQGFRVIKFFISRIIY